MYYLRIELRLQEPETYVRDGILLQQSITVTAVVRKGELFTTYIGGTAAWCWAQVLRSNTCAQR